MAGAVVARRLGATRSERAPSSSAHALWKPDDLIRWLLALGVGAVAVAVAWYVCAGDASFNQQIGPADAAIGGLLVAGLGNVTWLLRGRRALGERRRVLLVDVAEPEARRRVSRGHGAPGPSDTPLSAETGALYVAGEGLERFHRADCTLAAGRQGWFAMTRQAHEQAGRRPCDVCRP